MKWYLKVLKQYADFHGRASRTEYWMFVLFNLIAVVVLAFVEGFLGAATNTNQAVLTNIYQLAVLVPTLAVGWRRMHDTDHNGWWLIVPIVSLIFAVTRGTKGDNRFGPDPWGSSQY